MGALSDLMSGSPAEARDLLERLVGVARRRLPDPAEGVSYGVPALMHLGKPVIGFRVGRNDFSVYPFSAAVVAAAGQASPGLHCTKGSIHFTVAQPLTDELVELIVRLRVAEIENR